MSHPDAMQEYDDENTPAEMDDDAYAAWLTAQGLHPFTRLDDPAAQAQEDYEAWASAQDPLEEPHNTNYAAYLMEDSDNHINNGDILLRHMEAGTSWDDYLEEAFFKKGTK